MAVPSIFSSSLFFLLSLTTLCSAQNGGGGKGAAASELWCVAKNNADDSALQSALDWACGAGGANCAPIQPGGPCYDLSDIQQTASYAFNDYFIKHGMSEDSCNFSNTAALTSLNPSHSNCKFPSSSSANDKSYTGTVTGGIGPASADLSSSNSVLRRSNFSLVPILIIPLIFLMRC